MALSDSTIERVRFAWDEEFNVLRITGVDPRAHLTVKECLFWLAECPFKVAVGELVLSSDD